MSSHYSSQTSVDLRISMQMKRGTMAGVDLLPSRYLNHRETKAWPHLHSNAPEGQENGVTEQKLSTFMEKEMFFPAHSCVTVLCGKTGFTCRMQKKTFRNVLTSSTTGRLASYSHNGFHLGHVICIYIDLFLLSLLLSLSLDDIAPRITVTSFWCICWIW